MQMVFDVGSDERHQVRFTFNKFWGNLSIEVDGVNVVKTLRVASVTLVKSYDFVVGLQEQHHIHIEKHRKQLFAGFRPQLVYAYVDGQLVAQGTA
ncbi:hypothetical protein GCM10010435_16790 [Winogradskya consettensis]|uniref:Uncharacterized protein n=1 Tax=Winogradskya consettensis TaxID=113560 RepID=A0A919SUG6_9ACTN|nr:hypothetical protein [Actinoplanes consettensis]GIM78796.1 hypothetical protein Aco04nite_62260 [Actinoplanes consettensis]